MAEEVTDEESEAGGTESSGEESEREREKKWSERKRCDFIVVESEDNVISLSFVSL